MNIIIIGAGVVGRTIARKFSGEGQDIVIIEKDEHTIKELQESLDVKIIQGSGSSPEVLARAGIEQAEMVIAVTNSDEVNMIACLIAETQSRVPKKIARIRNPDYLNYTEIFQRDYLDLDFIINPERVAADRILKILETPGAIDVMDFIEGNLKLVGVKLSADSELTGKKARDLGAFFTNGNIIIVAIYRGDQTIIPQGKTVLEEGDLVFALTHQEEASSIPRLFGKINDDKGSDKIMIIGGGDVGFFLAVALEDKGHQVKIIEKNATRCEFLAEKLNKTIVISGDGTDQSLLKEENISDLDTFIAVTNDEEANILTSLLSKRLGARRSVALIDKPEYLSMVSTIGVDVAVSPRLASVSDILQFIRKGKVLSVKTLMEERVEAMETIAMETADIVGTPIKDIKFPMGAIIGAVVKGDDVLLPTGDTIIEPGDRVVIFTLPKTIPQVEKLLTVKPEFF
jgi:trk system potassium uptake protein TrkA